MRWRCHARVVVDADGVRVAAASLEVGGRRGRAILARHEQDPSVLLIVVIVVATAVTSARAAALAAFVNVPD